MAAECERPSKGPPGKADGQLGACQLPAAPAALRGTTTWTLHRYTSSCREEESCRVPGGCNQGAKGSHAFQHKRAHLGKALGIADRCWNHQGPTPVARQCDSGRDARIGMAAGVSACQDPRLEERRPLHLQARG
mmetsp:Transcript_6122/g.19050  ORF Transcript_6122/g.19050 Transcript_6122/m.19050 type:complete len:134 (+) Transcript_6122:834-1235(+)